MKEIKNGDTWTETSLVGASAAASHNAAENPHRIPSACSWRRREFSRKLSLIMELKLLNPHELVAHHDLQGEITRESWEVFKRQPSP
jgi:hypothetical protein